MLSQEKISSPACKESNHWYSHGWWLPSWSCHTPSIWRMAIRRMLSTWSLGICQRGGLKQTSLPVPTTEGQQSCKKFSTLIIPRLRHIYRVAPLTMSYNILCFTSNTYDITKFLLGFTQHMECHFIHYLSTNQNSLNQDPGHWELKIKFLNATQ